MVENLRAFGLALAGLGVSVAGFGFSQGNDSTVEFGAYVGFLGVLGALGAVCFALLEWNIVRRRRNKIDRLAIEGEALEKEVGIPEWGHHGWERRVDKWIEESAEWVRSEFGVSVWVTLNTESHLGTGFKMRIRKQILVREFVQDLQSLSPPK